MSSCCRCANTSVPPTQSILPVHSLLPHTPQELFLAPYFCQEQKPDYFALSAPLEGNPVVQRFAKLAAELGVVLPSKLDTAGSSLGSHSWSCNS